MKAIIWAKYGSPDVLQLGEVEKPAPKDDEVMVKIYGTSVTIGDCKIREAAAGVASGALTALLSLRNMGTIQSGHKALVYGASGSAGTYAIQLAKHFGADVAGACSTKNGELVKSLGADRVIDYTEEDFMERGDHYEFISIDVILWNRPPKPTGMSKQDKKRGMWP